MTLCAARRAAGEPVPAQCQARHAPVGRHMSTHSGAASLWVEEAPGHGADVVEESERVVGL